MTSHDVRDMLDLPGEAGPRPVKKQKISAPRTMLKGLAREVQNLSGDNPIAIVPEAIQFKKKRFGSRKPVGKWELKSFKNSARNDLSLILKHWRKKEGGSNAQAGEDGSSGSAGPVLEDSTFAKFNVHVETPSYTDEQYNEKLTNPDWSREETDYLMNLVKEYDLRWPIIWDRYDYQAPVPMEVDGAEGVMVQMPRPRQMEDLKLRYYAVAAAMMRLNNPPELMNAAEFNLLELMENFRPHQEIARKKFAEAAFSRTKEEAREEESLLLELKRILARSEKLSEERSELYARLEAPPSSSRDPIYNTSAGLQQLIQQLLSLDKSKKRKSLMGPEGTMSPAASGPSNANQQQQQQPAFERRDSVRESISGPSGLNNKREKEKQGPTERRKLTPEEEILYGVRYPERLTSGPAFRHERILKPLNNKSNVQRTKFDTVLSTLGVKQRLVMPTWNVGLAFESLLDNISHLLDQRKVLEKITGEIELLKRIKAEKERAARVARGEPRPGDVEPKVEEDGNAAEVKREKSAAPSVRPNSSGHKRSASVLSAVSDKSNKRQKK